MPVLNSFTAGTTSTWEEQACRRAPKQAEMPTSPLGENEKHLDMPWTPKARSDLPPTYLLERWADAGIVCMIKPQ